ncbi:hypothetical protein ES332_D04G005500v1 [Gossypium tomentosum]|uniref:Uncharacterized protein n=1 Tax=Gossypium tomentosum TaxID=34277 RepID=A0A5D2L7K8_GOSTO|nr:hypothetical protein ES332_D04G005500v1 [Gossypium tomentosum]
MVLPMTDLSFLSVLSFFRTLSASPSKHTSLKPISYAKITACKHACASAIVGSQIFSFG